MAGVSVAGAVSVEVGATKQDVESAANNLYDRLTGGRKRAIFRTLTGGVSLPAANYTNGVEMVINLGTPSDGKVWLVRSAMRMAVQNDASTPPAWLSTATPPDVHLMVGTCPQNTAVGKISDRPTVSDIIVPFLGDASNDGTIDPSFSQPFLVYPHQSLYAYLVASAALNLAKDTLYVVNATVMEMDGSQLLVGGV